MLRSVGDDPSSSEGTNGTLATTGQIMVSVVERLNRRRLGLGSAAVSGTLRSSDSDTTRLTLGRLLAKFDKKPFGFDDSSKVETREALDDPDDGVSGSPALTWNVT